MAELKFCKFVNPQSENCVPSTAPRRGRISLNVKMSVERSLRGCGLSIFDLLFAQLEKRRAFAWAQAIWQTD